MWLIAKLFSSPLDLVQSNKNNRELAPEKWPFSEKEDFSIRQKKFLRWEKHSIEEK